MAMTKLRPNVGLAIDGGGIKGLIIARELVALEKELGCKRLLDYDPLRIFAGTSTGAILTGGISIGMDAAAIGEIYRNVGQQVFPRLVARWIPKAWRPTLELLLAARRHSLYSNTKLISVLKQGIKDQTDDADITLAEVQERMGPEKALILTTVNITDRRTHLLKSYSSNDGEWPLWEAILASSSVPPALPVWKRIEHGIPAYYTDGGVGTYGNPAYVVAQEAVAIRGYDPSQVSILSFGTGWLNASNFEREHHAPAEWRGIDWALRAPDLFIADTIRSESLDIIENPATSAIDFRRFQFEYEEEIPADTFGEDSTYEHMIKLGDDLGTRIGENLFACEQRPQYDPEGLYLHRAKYRAAKLSKGRRQRQAQA